MIIQSIGFGPEEIEVTYLDDPEDKSGVVKLETLIVPKRLTPEAYDDLIEAAETLVDAALIVRRNPPTSFRGTR